MCVCVLNINIYALWHDIEVPISVQIKVLKVRGWLYSS